MTIFTSNYSVSELIKRWDDYTSISRFAGCDDTMDLIFCSTRKGNKIKLVRKARAAKEPFSVIFRGNIKKTDSGSQIAGIFTKSIIDYIVVGMILALVFCMRYYVMARQENLGTVNTLLIAAIVISFFGLICRRKTKRKYAEFIYKITGIDEGLFESKKLFKKD